MKWMNELTGDQINEPMETNPLAPLHSQLPFHLIWQSHLSRELILDRLWESSDFSLLSASACSSSALHTHSHLVSQCQNTHDKRPVINSDAVWTTTCGRELHPFYYNNEL